MFRPDRDAEVSGGRKMTAAIAPRPFCWKCGLLQGEPDYAGCTMDILSDHEYVLASTRPYQGLTFDEVAARYGRARLKAKSAQLTADHFAVCAVGPSEFVTDLYRQKAIKRTRIAEALWVELQARIDDAATDLPKDRVVCTITEPHSIAECALYRDDDAWEAVDIGLLTRKFTHVDP